MSTLRILTAGESHGPCLTAIIEGLPAGLVLDQDKINHQLWRRQQGYGRGGRMAIESDTVEIHSGLRFGKTLGSPLTLQITNKDWKNWTERMAVWEGTEINPVSVPRPGHADLAGIKKYGFTDIRDVLERASARETAARVAAGAVCRQLLEEIGVRIGGHVIQIHTAGSSKTFRSLLSQPLEHFNRQIRELCELAEKSDVRCADEKASQAMAAAIDTAKKDGDSVGGIFETAALNVPAGLGSHVMWDRRLDAHIAGDIMSIPGVKSVEIGLGADCAERKGSEVHDPIILKDDKTPGRPSNNAGGLEGGISNGMPIVLRAAMKPIPTLVRPLPSVDLSKGVLVQAHKERSDTCAVPAASVVSEAMLCMTLAKSVCSRYGADTMIQIKKQIHA